MRIFFSFLCFLIPVGALIGQVDTIPFHLTSSNNIGITVIINEIDTLDLMFHTGSSAVFVTEDARTKIKSINMNQSAQVNTWGGTGDVRFSENNTLQIGQMKWDSIKITEDRYTGPGLDGKFGYNLFEDKILEINFDHSELIVHTTLPKTIEGYQKMNYEYQLGSMFIEGQALLGGKEYSNKVMIHSGYAGAVLFDDQFVSDNELAELLETISEQDLKDSLGNIIKTKKSKLPQFRIGDIVFKDITVGMFAGSLGRQKFSVMGGDLLKRFNMIFDFKNQDVYLKSNNLKQLPFLK